MPAFLRFYHLAPDGKLGFVGIAKGFPLGGSCLRSRLMRGQVWNSFPFIATSSGSLRSPPSPQGEGFGVVQTVESFPLGSEPETGMRQRRIPGRVQ